MHKSFNIGHLWGIPAWVWSCIFLVIIFALNSLSVRVYGESEYWFALIKVVTVIIFIIIGLLTILGIMGGEFVGFETFTKGDGPILGGNLGGSLLSILGVFLVAGFSFQGTELIGITVENLKIQNALYLKLLNKYSGEYYYSTY